MTVHSKKAAKRRRRTVSEKEATIQSVLRALPVTAGIGLLLLFITAALLMQTSDPDRYHTVAGYGLIYVTAFCGAFAATRFNGRHAPLLCGVLEGVFLLVLITIAGFCLPSALKNGLSPIVSLLTHALVLPASMLGGLTASAQKKGRHKHRR